MTNNLFIRKDAIKRKYELSFNDKDLSFELVFRKKYLDFFRTLPNVQSIISNYDKDFKFEKKWDFASDISFGHNHCIKIMPKSNEFILLRIPIFRANGSAISCSLELIFQLLNSLVDNEEVLDGDKEQEMFLETTSSSEFKYYGAAMNADLSSKFSLWIYNQTEKKSQEINSAINLSMNNLYRELYQMEPVDQNRSGLVRHGFLLVPPAGIYTSQFGILGEDEVRFNPSPEHVFGYKTFCHNLDSWHEQLVLLAGFTKICEAYRMSN